MNIKAFVVGLFNRGIHSHINGQLESVRQAARDDASLVVGSYLDAFEERAAELLTVRQQRLIGAEPEPIKAAKRARR